MGLDAYHDQIGAGLSVTGVRMGRMRLDAGRDALDGTGACA